MIELFSWLAAPLRGRMFARSRQLRPLTHSSMHAAAALGLLLLLFAGYAAHHYRVLSGDDVGLPADVSLLVAAGARSRFGKGWRGRICALSC